MTVDDEKQVPQMKKKIANNDSRDLSHVQSTGNSKWGPSNQIIKLVV